MTRYEKLAKLQAALISAGRVMESMGQYKVAIKIAEAALLMCDAFDPDQLEDEAAADLDKVRILLPEVIERIMARMEKVANV